MSNRVIREALLESDAWVRLSGNDRRLAFVACLLKADDYGNFPASPERLMRQWRIFGVETVEHATEIMTELGSADLIRWYTANGKRYGHVPQFRQRIRQLKLTCPRPPEAIECNEIKQLIQNLSAIGSAMRPNRIESNQNQKKQLGSSKQNSTRQPVDNFSKQPQPVDNFTRTQQDRARRLAELLGISRLPLDTDQSFADRVQAALDAQAVRLPAATGRRRVGIHGKGIDE